MEFKIPEIAENVNSGTIVSIFVSKGDQVKKNQDLFELESEKASLPVPSPCDGTVQEILIKEGDEVKVGQVVIKIDESASKSGSEEGSAKDKESNEEEPQKEPPKDKQPQKKEEKEAESEKTGQEKESKQTPESKSEPEEAQKATETQAEKVKAPEEETQQETPAAKSSEDIPAQTDVPAAPSVRRFAREIGVEISKVTGSEAGGRISEEDVKAYAKKLLSGIDQRQTGSAQLATPALPDFSNWGEVERAKMSNVRKKTASHLSICWHTIPHVTHFDKVDITDLEKLRKDYSTKDRKLTVTPFLVKILASALKEFPQFNASLDMETNEIIYKKYYHIGVAIDTERGLLVPPLRDVDKKNILELNDELNELTKKAHDRKLSFDDLKGGCITLTNLGGIGGTEFTPIINWPEAAILGVARSTWEPHYEDGQFVPRFKLPLALSYDHRLIDGADAARFLKWIVEAIERPLFMELEG